MRKVVVFMMALVGLFALVGWPWRMMGAPVVHDVDWCR